MSESGIDIYDLLNQARLAEACESYDEAAVAYTDLMRVFGEERDYIRAFECCNAMIRVTSHFENPNFHRALCYYGCANVFSASGNNEHALTLIDSALEAWANVDRPDLPDMKKISIYGDIIISKAIISVNVSKLSDAYELLREFLWGDKRDVPHAIGDLPHRTSALFILGTICQHWKDYDQAMEFFGKAASVVFPGPRIAPKKIGEAKNMYLTLFHAYMDHGRTEDAVRVGVMSRDALLSRGVGMDDFSVKLICRELGELYLKLGELGKASEYYALSAGLYDETPRTPAETALLFTRSSMMSGNYPEEELVKMFPTAAKGLFQKTGGLSQIGRMGFIGLCVCGYLVRGEKDGAVAFTKLLMDEYASAVSTVANLPERRQRINFIGKLDYYKQPVYDAYFAYPDAFDDSELYDLELIIKNADAEIEYRQAIFERENQDPDRAEQSKKLKDLRDEFARMAIDGGDEEESKRLTREINDASYEVLKRYNRDRFADGFSYAKAADVRAVLDDETAIVEYGVYTDVGTGDGDKAFYYAYATTKNGVTLHKLCLVSEAGALITALVGDADNKEVGLIERRKDCATELAALFDLLVKPLDNYLDGIKNLYIVPDGDLYRLPFELLGGGVPLRERFSSIAYLSSGREVLRDVKPFKKTALVVADPLFNVNADNAAAAVAPSADDTPLSGNPTTRALRGEIKPQNITPLPFTKTEGEEVAKLFNGGAEVIRGVEADKHALKDAGSYGVIHIATHGFALNPQGGDAFLRCGLLFAGAYNHFSDESAPARLGNGVLTAEEVFSLDLQDCRLLVLSACDTGLGHTQSGDGVKGLRRAFELAGAGGLICSLWPVNDFTGMLLMKKFYEELLSENGNASAALSRAKKYVADLSAADLRALLNDYSTPVDDATAAFLTAAAMGQMSERPFNHPYFWAGFVLQGKIN